MKLLKKKKTVGHIEWTYYIGGKGEPLYVIPPFHSDYERLRPVLEYLSQYYIVYFPELPGIATKTPLAGLNHTAETYAVLLSEFFGKFEKRRFSILGLSLGGVIAVRMFENGFRLPEKFIAYGTPYDAKFIYPEPTQKAGLLFFRHIHHPIIREWFCRLVLCNPFLVGLVLAVRYAGYSNWWQILSHQVKLTVNMHPRAWRDIIEDILSLSLSKITLTFQIPTLLVYNRNDNILDVEQTVCGMKTLFPHARVKYLYGALHAPAGPLTADDVKAMVAPVVESGNT